MDEIKFSPSSLHRVRNQYERFPYPPVSPVAIPRRTQGQGLCYEKGMAGGVDPGRVRAKHDGIRILVAGAGTLEPLVVAQRHPRAKEIVAVDCSAASVERLTIRLSLAGIRQSLLWPLNWRRDRHRPQVRVVRADLLDWEEGQFDYIIATNVLHHLPDPPKMLARLTGWLAPGGLLRLVTYASQSRYWVNQTAQWLALSGLHIDSPGLRRACYRAVARLPVGHPIRASFQALGERTHLTSLVDAYFHACDNPLSPMNWKHACDACGLRLVGEGQHPNSRSNVLDQLMPAVKALGVWEKLQILDDLLELASSPVLWLRKEVTLSNTSDSSCRARRPQFGLSAGPSSATRDASIAKRLDSTGDLFYERDGGAVSEPKRSPVESKTERERVTSSETWDSDRLTRSYEAVLTLNKRYRLPSRTYFALRFGVDRAQSFLDSVGIRVEDVVRALGAEFGPRYTRDQGNVLAGLTLSEYDAATLCRAQEPWTDLQWLDQETLLGPGVRIVTEDGLIAPRGNLCDQARWVQVVLGPAMPFIPIRLARYK